MPNRPNHWRVWQGGRAVTRPTYLPESHDRWRPIASAESWDGGTGGACNGFLYDFHQVQIAHSPGGRWRLLSRASSSATRIRRRGGAFLAAEGAGLRLLFAHTP